MDKVVVKSESLAKEWYFLCGKWLDTNQDDGKVRIEPIGDDILNNYERLRENCYRKTKMGKHQFLWLDIELL